MNDKALVNSVGLEPGKSPIMERKKGRILYNHSLMYILEGRGYFQDESTRRVEVVPGSIFYLYPGRWHRFDPDHGTVWTEYWVNFNGKKVEERFGKLLPEGGPVYNIGIAESIVESYEILYDLWFYRPKGFEVYSNFLLHGILTEAYIKVNGLKFKRTEDTIHRLKYSMRKSLDLQEFDLKNFAKKENTTYDSLRKQFKKETGFSPVNYFLMLKMTMAKELLMKPRLTVKEIAFRLGFEDQYYFSRMFRVKTGVSPRQYRENSAAYGGQGKIINLSRTPDRGEPDEKGA